jgi:2-phospho-L-lactate/phosphoenolpyruvate guanylyltransferase
VSAIVQGTVVLVPVRSFRTGWTRLHAALPPDERSRLAVRSATRVREAAGDLPVVVMTCDPEVREWAAASGAQTLRDAGWDLNSSLGGVVESLRARGADRVVVAHADLPLADDLTWLRDTGGVVIVPDRRADGTNVLAIPADAGFRFSYGLASSHHHDGEALRLGLRATVVRDPLLAWDVDVPEDLELPEGTELEALRRASQRARSAAAAHNVAPAPASS